MWPPMWFPACDFPHVTPHVISHMWFPVCDFPHVISRMWCCMWFPACDFPYVISRMWFSACDALCGTVCDRLHVMPYVIYRMWFTACDLPHVIYRMWVHMWLSPIVTYGPYVITYGPYVIFRMWFWWPYVGPHVIITVCDPTCDHFFRWDETLSRCGM